jgi:serine/threonine-protein kinase
LVALKANPKTNRNRLIAIGFVSALLVLLYGPLAPWFVTADRLLYDQLAGHMPRKPLENALIVSIDPGKSTAAQLLDRYGQVISAIKQTDASRIVLAQPPEVAAGDRLPDWAASLSTGVPVYAPTHHPFGDLANRDGFVEILTDRDGTLRRAALWQLNDGVMDPALPLAVSFDSGDTRNDPRFSTAVDAIHASRYVELPRLDVEELLSPAFDRLRLREATVFVDSAPKLAGAAAVLPSGQFVTVSELMAALLADIEHGKTIVAPRWVSAFELLIPALLAIAAILFMPERSRKDIAVLAGITVAALLLTEMLLLYVFQVRIDLGRPVLVLAAATLLSLWLVVDKKKETRDAFKRGSDFLAAGRLEPAFAEFRRCPPSETIASVMYKLSLAFEEQSKPERAEAVLEWMKRTQGAPPVTALLGGDGVDGVPRRLGRYVIEKRIGRGAMGAVYLARDPRINRPVALKAIPIEKEFEDEELKEARLRFYREAESAGRLTHPNIITVYDAGEDKGLAYIAMEYVPGIPLKKFTDPTRLLAPKRALELCAATAEALDYAHNQGVIHRDIKPANLLYNPKEGSLKITDFGVARMTDNNNTKTGVVLGTPMYMSPEQLSAEELTGLSDLFSLGVTLYELLIGEPPFQATNIAVLMTKISTEEAAPLAHRRAGIPPGVDAILEKAMAKRPEDRFSCCAEMALALRNCAHVS